MTQIKIKYSEDTVFFEKKKKIYEYRGLENNKRNAHEIHKYRKQVIPGNKVVHRYIINSKEGIVLEIYNQHGTCKVQYDHGIFWNYICDLKSS